jgi:2-polyprenyl-6-methoxyphenol hydroxylase-like FAD-dependent oxidoreductase
MSMNHVIQRIGGTRPPNSGEGPCIVFVGDAYMTIDPILAQGFTVAMEGAFATRRSVQNSCQVTDPNSAYAFDPYCK